MKGDRGCLSPPGPQWVWWLSLVFGENVGFEIRPRYSRGYRLLASPGQCRGSRGGTWKPVDYLFFSVAISGLVQPGYALA